MNAQASMALCFSSVSQDPLHRQSIEADEVSDLGLVTLICKQFGPRSSLTKCRGVSRISGKGVHMYTGVGGSLC